MNLSGVLAGLRIQGTFSVFKFIVLTHLLNMGTTPVYSRRPQTCSDTLDNGPRAKEVLSKLGAR